MNNFSKVYQSVWQRCTPNKPYSSVKTILSLSLWVLVLGVFGTETPAQTAPKQIGSSSAFYPRVIRLQHNGPANGRLLASLEGYNVPGSAFFESTDDGATWSSNPVGTAVDNTPPRNCCSTLWEVPQQLGNTAAGTLFWSTSVGTDQTPRTACKIVIYKSTDQARTWQYFSTVVTGNTGLWEPEFVIDSQGRLLCFFSSEEYKAQNYNQLLAHRVSTDGGLTWGSDVFDVALPGERPGMAIVRKLPNGTYVMTYERVGGDYGHVYIKFSSNGYDWNASTTGTRIESTRGNMMAAAPTINWINDGTPNGRLVAIGSVLKTNINTVAAANGYVFMANSNNGVGPWTEYEAPVPAPTPNADPANNYTSQLIGSADGSRITEVAVRNAKIYHNTTAYIPISTTNLVFNQSFEKDYAGWGQWPDGSHAGISVNERPQQGSRNGYHYGTGSYQQYTSQVITGLTTGRYVFRAYILSTGGQGQAYIGIKNFGNGPEVHTGNFAANTASWTLYEQAVDVVGSQAEVFFWSNSNNGTQWIAFDNASFTRQDGSIANGTYRLVVRHSGQVLDLDGCSTANGAIIKQYPWLNNNCQRWNIEAASDGYYRIISVHSGKALDVDACNTLNGGKVQQYTSFNNYCQQWRFEPVGDGYYRIVNRNSGKVLDVDACSQVAGTKVQQWEWLGGDCQRWRPEAVSATARLSAEPQPGLWDQAGVSVYPNPASGRVSVSYTPLQSGAVSIDLVDFQGRLLQPLFKGQSQQGVRQRHEVECGALSSGMYLLRLSTPAGSYHHKLIKQ